MGSYNNFIFFTCKTNKVIITFLIFNLPIFPFYDDVLTYHY